MKKFTKIVSLLLCLALALSLCACGGEKVTSNAGFTDDETKHETIKWALRTSQPAGFEEVLAAANEYLGEKLNITLDLQCIEPGDYNSKIQLALASGEQLDLIWTSNWSNPYEKNASKGAYLALDELLELPELAELKNYYSEGIWEATKVAGKIYGVPIEQALYDQPGIEYMKEQAERNNVVGLIENASSMDHLEEIFTIVRDAEPADYNILIASSTYFEEYYPMVNGYKIKDGKVFLDTENELDYNIRMRKWNQLKFFPADVATNDNLDALQKQGKVFADYNRYLPGNETKGNRSYQVITRPTGEAVMNRGGIQSTLWALGMNCKNPVRALKLVNLMLHDEYILNLLSYGLEGRDFEKDPENPKRMTRLTDYYISEFMLGSQFLAYLVPGYEDNVWEETKAGNESARVDDLIGFSFDPTPVESQISQISAVGQEYGKILGFGLDADPESMFYEQEKKKDLAGRDVVIEEIERQLDAWYATQE